jgi:hypothetical protein
LTALAAGTRGSAGGGEAWAAAPRTVLMQGARPHVVKACKVAASCRRSTRDIETPHVCRTARPKRQRARRHSCRTQHQSCITSQASGRAVKLASIRPTRRARPLKTDPPHAFLPFAAAQRAAHAAILRETWRARVFPYQQRPFRTCGAAVPGRLRCVCVSLFSSVERVLNRKMARQHTNGSPNTHSSGDMTRHEGRGRRLSYTLMARLSHP